VRADRRDALPNTQWAKLRSMLALNGPRWVAYHLADRGARRASEYFEKKTTDLEIARQLPGENTIEYNRFAWSNYDWDSQRGDEWTISTEWARSLVDDVMYGELPPDSGATVLEIGPGAGRWTQPLHARAKRLLLVDITDRTLELCRNRLGDPDNIAYHVSDGRSLGDVDSGSVDFVWSFDAFVHIAPQDARGYIQDFARVMRPGARGIVHHAGAGNVGGWRSSMTGELFAQYLKQGGLRMISQFDRWGAEQQHAVPQEGDLITLFERP
jgi:SAM-dependent methyltransferase